MRGASLSSVLLSKEIFLFCYTGFNCTSSSVRNLFKAVKNKNELSLIRVFSEKKSEPETWGCVNANSMEL